jgi:phage-related protein/predicted XRE-type DNA-binding protein
LNRGNVLKKVDFVGSSLDDLREFPEEVKQDIGYALFEVQKGGKPASAKPLKGFGGAGVLEIIENSAGDAYRAVYTVRFEKVVYVLHCFQKKSKHGIKTPKQDIDLIKQRLRLAEEAYKANREGEEYVMSTKEKVHKGSGNVFVDVGVAHPERVMARAQIMLRISEIIKERGLTQRKASKLLDIPQSKVSCLMNGKLSNFSLDHLFELLNALDRDVEIIIKPKTKEEKFATTQVLLTAFA